MNRATRDLVRLRAKDCCEYCLIPQAATRFFTFHIEHIIAKQHVGDSDDPAGLAFSCNRCNAYKGPNLSSVDSETQKVVPLFNPRRDKWTDHFRIKDGEVIGLTPIGRATARLLKMNAPHRIELRDTWMES